MSLDNANPTQNKLFSHASVVTVFFRKYIFNLLLVVSNLNNHRKVLFVISGTWLEIGFAKTRSDKYVIEPKSTLRC